MYGTKLFAEAMGEDISVGERSVERGEVFLKKKLDPTEVRMLA